MCGYARPYALWLAVAVIFGCAPQRPIRDDPVLRLGPLQIGESARDVARTFGVGASARRADLKGVVRDERLFRHGSAVLGIGFSGDRVTSFVAYERLTTPADVRREFAMFAGDEPRSTAVAIDGLTWLGAPVFAPVLPATPEGWRVPTDFTISTSAMQMLVVRGDHTASKASSVNDGWIVDVR